MHMHTYQRVSVRSLGKKVMHSGSGLFSCGMTRSFTRGFKVFDSEQGEGKLEVNGRRGVAFALPQVLMKTCQMFGGLVRDSEAFRFAKPD